LYGRCNGGTFYCEPPNLTSNYGKLNVSWNSGLYSYDRLWDWLASDAPNANSAPMFINGLKITPADRPKITSTTTQVCTNGVVFTLENKPYGQITWVLEENNNGLFQITNQNGYQATVKKIGNGNSSAKLKAKKGNQEAAFTVITACPSPPPTITGNTVCVGGSQYVLDNSPGGTIHWTVTAPFSFSQTSVVFTTTVTSPTIYVYGSYTNVGTLTARKVNASGEIIASRSISSCPTQIVGTSMMCFSNVYYLNTLESASWSVNNSYFSVSPSTGTHVTVTATTAHGQTAQLKAVVGNNTYTFNIEACKATLSGPDKICNTSQAFYVITQGAEVDRWTTGGPFSIVSSTPYTAYVSTSATNGEGGAVIGILKNGGTSAASKNVIASCGKGGSNTGYVVAFPNPADDILYVSIDADAAKAQLPTQVNVGLTFDVRLYDNRGSLLQQKKTKGGLIDFNVSNLIDGVYNLHIYNGVNATPEMLQIVVQH